MEPLPTPPRPTGLCARPQGRQSAADAAQRLNGLGLVDGLFSSPLGRARATAEVIAGAIGLPVLVLDGLAEVHHGDFAGLTNSQIEERYPGALADHPEQKYTLRFPSGESYQDVDRRAETAYRHIEKTGANAPLLVRHEMVGRMLLSRLLGLDPENALKRSLAHRAIYEITPGAKVVANL